MGYKKTDFLKVARVAEVVVVKKLICWLALSTLWLGCARSPRFSDPSAPAIDMSQEQIRLNFKREIMAEVKTTMTELEG